jgi:hypothetical protein
MDPKILHIKAYISEEKESVDEANHRILFAIPETVDRDDEVVTAEAIFTAMNDKKSFAANPICLPCHQHRLGGGEPPCVGSWDVESAKQLKNAVNIWLNFAVGTKLGDEYWNCYRKKHMRAVSIGFRTRAFEMEERSGKQIRVITKIELYEISCVAVGCNPGALSKLKAEFGWQDEEDEKEIKDYIQKIVEAKIAELHTEIEDLKSLIIPDSGELAEKLLHGDDSESFASAGKNKAGQDTLSKLLKVIENFRSN